MLNDRDVEVECADDTRLVDLLREDLRLTGTKEGCAVGVCGLCSVLVDDELMSACLLLAVLLEGREVRTVEGLAAPDGLSDLQEAFVVAGGFQCGICTPGQIVAATALLAEEQEPDPGVVSDWMKGNLCRCTGYEGIKSAIHIVASNPSS